MEKERKRLGLSHGEYLDYLARKHQDTIEKLKGSSLASS